MYARHRHGRRRRCFYHRQTLLVLLHIIVRVLYRDGDVSLGNIIYIIYYVHCIIISLSRHHIIIIHIVAYRSQAACTVNITNDVFYVASILMFMFKSAIRVRRERRLNVFLEPESGLSLYLSHSNPRRKFRPHSYFIQT